MKNTATEKTTEKRTAIYARQSVDKKDSISVETQIELCRTRCGEDAVCIYTDRGFSGKNLKRPGYIKMTGDIACGKIRRVMVYRLDRLSRSVGDFSKMWEIFERYGVEFSSISEQFDTSTPIGKAMVYIIMTFAQLERETIAERVSDNYYSRIRTGAWPGGRAPFGFCNTRLISGGHSVPSLSADENAPTVCRIFSEYASSGRSLASIAKELSKEKIRFRGTLPRLGQQISVPHAAFPCLHISRPRRPALLPEYGNRYDLQQRRGIRRYIFRPYRRKTFLSDICKQSDVAAHSVSDEFPRYCRLRYLASLPAAPGSEQTAGKAGNGKSLLAFRYPPMRFLRLFHPHQKSRRQALSQLQRQT